MFELEKIVGCLSNKKTLDSAARRRQPIESDEDLWMMHFGNDFSIDAFGKIIVSKAFRRLDSKTQVLTANVNPHVRKRNSHTSEVVNAATTIARILGLNEKLCLAIALGHDIGHAPFGHLGETFISKITGKDFHHETFGVVIAQYIERQGKGLNLTYQVLEGIENHSRGLNALSRKESISEEANVVMCADKIAYILADINDIFDRTRILDYKKFPKIYKLAHTCGNNQRERMAFFIKNLCQESAENGCVSFVNSEAAKIFAELKDNMYEAYNLVNLQNSVEILGKIYSFLSETKLIGNVNPALVLALMTDIEVLYLYRKDYINGRDFYDCSVAEIVEHLNGKNINFTNPDLDW
ncbi:MAG: HD domain-containing protein [Candidatus Pacebacteria bacterium]|nr:HD domain-containing protein [Candidatus Paceibacterota bacterium]